MPDRLQSIAQGYPGAGWPPYAQFMLGTEPSGAASPPSFCQYAAGACVRPNVTPAERTRIFIAYPGHPELISSTIETAVGSLRDTSPGVEWLTWRDLNPTGQVILCSICEAIRTSSLVVADVTKLNHNVMFEIGFAIGLGLPVVPLRDTSLVADERVFKELGLLDTLTYLEYTNSDQLASKMRAALVPPPLQFPPDKADSGNPVFLMKSPIVVDGAIALESALKKARLRYRSFDPRETPRISLIDLMRQVSVSAGVVVEMLASARTERAHNAKCAFACGLAVAMGKAVLMLQEQIDPESADLDYRDIAKVYSNAANVSGLARPFFDQVIEFIQSPSLSVGIGDQSPLVQIDLGDVAAENEILGLREYFLPTGPSSQAEKGHARLVIGRKGSGKTAIFYRVRDAVQRGRERLVMEMKPEGDQFTRFKEAVLDRLGEGLKEHTLVAFWQYLIASEIARLALRKDERVAKLDPLSWERYSALADAYGPQDPGVELDFAQRLNWQLDRVTRQLDRVDVQAVGPKLTQILYSGEQKKLTQAVREYIAHREAVWLLVDNLDKGWPIKGASSTDVLIARSLLEAARKIQNDFADRNVDFNCVVFLRSDIYELLREQTPDKGKDRPILLDWDDPQVFEQLVWLRIQSAFPDCASFDQAWQYVCVPLIKGQASFDYIVERTLMRPRDLLQFLRHCIDVAVNRGRVRIEEEDVDQAERGYSQDMLIDFAYEIADTHPEYEWLPWVFEQASAKMTVDEVQDRIMQMLGMGSAQASAAIDFLVSLGFLGVDVRGGEPKFSYQLRGLTKQLSFSVRASDAELVIHPAFRVALGCE